MRCCLMSMTPFMETSSIPRAQSTSWLDWLAGAGLSVGMLYVDAFNEAAVALYRSLGFTEDHTDRAYSRVVDSMTSIR